MPTRTTDGCRLGERKKSSVEHFTSSVNLLYFTHLFYTSMRNCFIYALFSKFINKATLPRNWVSWTLRSAILLKASTRTQSCGIYNSSKFVLRRYCRLIKIELYANYNKKEFISWIVLIAIVSKISAVSYDCFSDKSSPFSSFFLRKLIRPLRVLARSRLCLYSPSSLMNSANFLSIPRFFM